jgi:hypothetical protein
VNLKLFSLWNRPLKLLVVHANSNKSFKENSVSHQQELNIFLQLFNSFLELQKGEIASNNTQTRPRTRYEWEINHRKQTQQTQQTHSDATIKTTEQLKLPYDTFQQNSTHPSSVFSSHFQHLH